MRPGKLFGAVSDVIVKAAAFDRRRHYLLKLDLWGGLLVGYHTAEKVSFGEYPENLPFLLDNNRSDVCFGH